MFLKPRNTKIPKSAPKQFSDFFHQAHQHALLIQVIVIFFVSHPPFSPRSYKPKNTFNCKILIKIIKKIFVKLNTPTLIYMRKLTAHLGTQPHTGIYGSNYGIEVGETTYWTTLPKGAPKNINSNC